MAVDQTATTTLRVSASAPATFDESGYNTLFTASPLPALVGSIETFGDFGAEDQVITFNPIATRVTTKFKGASDPGNLDLELGLDTDDAGQIIMKAARASLNDYYFMATLPSGDRYFFSGKVTSWRVRLGGVNDVTMASSSIALTSQSDGTNIVESLA